MKLIVLFLLGILSLNANAASTTTNAEKVSKYLTQYGMQRVRGIRLMRAGGGQQCYEKYIPQVSVIAERGANETKDCNNRAASRKQDELAKVELQRAEISRQVQAVLDSLNKCSLNTDVIVFLRCLKTDASINLDYVQQIAKEAIDVYDKIEGSISTIDLNENTCIASVLARAKQDTDELFADLQRCLINGFIDPVPETSSEPSSETSAEPSPETSPEPSPKTSSEPSSETSAEPSPETSAEPSPETSSQPGPEPKPVPSTTPSQEPNPNDDTNPDLYPEADI